jgi:DNA replication and repair protein RecF
MGIKKLKLTNFRNFKGKLLEFSEGITIILGPNASGKTNILESLFLLSVGKSFKARVEAEMLRYEQDLARVSGRLPDVLLEAIITRGSNGWPRKKLMVNRVPKRLVDFGGNFKMVLFGPWDLDLITESPSLRRKFLDTVLGQVDREYRRSALSYEKGLRQRNRLLYRIREEGLPRSQLLFWDQLLVRNGDYISRARENFTAYINGREPLNEASFRVDYDKSVI